MYDNIVQYGAASETETGIKNGLRTVAEVSFGLRPCYSLMRDGLEARTKQSVDPRFSMYLELW